MKNDMLVRRQHEHTSQRGLWRDSTIDVIKGFGIILMVLGHCGFPFTGVVYMFHMAIFFMASGYLWKNDYVRNWNELKRFCWRRIKALWLPSVIANGIFILLNNFFISIGLYSVDPSYEAISQGASPQVWFDGGTLVIGLLKLVVFLGGSQMGGALWFLRVLFTISIGHGLVVYFSFACRKTMKYLPMLIAALTIVACEILSFVDLNIPTIIKACFSGYLAFWIGIIIREKNLIKYIPNRWWITLLCTTGLLFLLSSIGQINMGRGEITSVGFFVIASVTGWVFCWTIAAHISGTIKSALQHLGRHTLWIVILHFLSFKIVTY